MVADVDGLRGFLAEHAESFTPSECRTLGVIHVLLIAADLGTVEADVLQRVLAPYLPPFTDPRCADAFIAGEATAAFDLRNIPPAPLVASLRNLAADAL